MAVGIPLGPYRLVRRLASGGMAEIFLARQEGKDGFARDLVVKRILPHLAADPEFTRMFRDEARLAAQLSHPNVVHVYDFGSEPDDDGEVLWLAMELVRGVDLRALIVRAVEEARARGARDALPPHHAAKIVSFVCEALAHAHSLRVDGKPAGVVHRDVTPSNVLVSFDGAVKLADFGIAKARGGKGREPTEHGVVKGKLAYLSPEQARGESLDARSDLFNVGILLFEAMLGEPLFPHDDFRKAKMLSAAGRIPDPERIDRVPPALAQVLRRALAPRREDRYADALSLRADLETFLRAAPETSDTVELGRFVRHHFPDALEEDARAPRAAGTVASSAVRPGTQAITPSSPPSGAAEVAPADAPPVAPAGTQQIAEDAARTVVASPPTALARAVPRAAPPAPPPPAALFPPARALDPPLSAAGPTLDGVPSSRSSSPDAREPARARARYALIASAVLLTLASVAGIAIVATTPEPPVAPLVPPPLPPRAAATPQPVPAELRVLSEPPGQDLFVDARPVGATPALLTLAAGAHRVEVRDPRGALLATELVTLEAGEVRELALEVALPSALATLRVGSTPAGAAVRIDGDEAGVTPLIAEVSPSRHHVDVALDGYVSAASDVVLQQPGEQATLAFALTRAPATGRRGGGRRGGGGGATAGGTGTLTIATTPWSEVYLGGRHLGTTPLANVALPAGTHVLTLRSPGRGARRTSVTIRPGETTRVRMVL